MTPTTPQAHPEFHTVELRLPIDVAEELSAKAGSIDDAVVHALQEYLKTDFNRRDQVIKHVHSVGKTVEAIARIYAMSEEEIQKIIDN